MFINFWYPAGLSSRDRRQAREAAHARPGLRALARFRRRRCTACRIPAFTAAARSPAAASRTTRCMCPYHGWQFDGDGRCTKIPSLGHDAKIPGRVRVDSYPVVGEVRPRLRVPRRPARGRALPDHGHPGVPRRRSPTRAGVATIQHFDWDFDFQRSMENGIDGAHNEFVHPTHGYSGERDDIRIPTENYRWVDTEWDTGMFSSRRAPPLADPVMREASGRHEDGVITRRHRPPRRRADLDAHSPDREDEHPPVPVRNADRRRQDEPVPGEPAQFPPRRVRRHAHDDPQRRSWPRRTATCSTTCGPVLTPLHPHEGILHARRRRRRQVPRQAEDLGRPRLAHRHGRGQPQPASAWPTPSRARPGASTRAGSWMRCRCARRARSARPELRPRRRRTPCPAARPGSMSTTPADDPVCSRVAASSVIADVIDARPRDLGGFTVRRVLPVAGAPPGRARSSSSITWARRISAGRRHRRAAASAHRRSRRSRTCSRARSCTATASARVQTIRPGDVNWMTAGRGIVHSERTAPGAARDGARLHGLQLWVALPRAHEETRARASTTTRRRACRFRAAARVHVRVIAGTAYGVDLAGEDAVAARSTSTPSCRRQRG